MSWHRLNWADNNSDKLSEESVDLLIKNTQKADEYLFKTWIDYLNEHPTGKSCKREIQNHIYCLNKLPHNFLNTKFNKIKEDYTLFSTYCWLINTIISWNSLYFVNYNEFPSEGKPELWVKDKINAVKGKK